jgi:hypothetical protein
VVLRGVRVTRNLEPQAHIEVSVEAGEVVGGHFQHRLGRGHSPIEAVDLAHGHTKIVPHRKEQLLGASRRLLPRNAQEMPDRVLDIVRIDRSMRLELGSAVVPSLRVVERDTALPEIWHPVGIHLDETIEPFQRHLDPSRRELRDGDVARGGRRHQKSRDRPKLDDRLNLMAKKRATSVPDHADATQRAATA